MGSRTPLLNTFFIVSSLSLPNTPLILCQDFQLFILFWGAGGEVVGGRDNTFWSKSLHKRDPDGMSTGMWYRVAARGRQIRGREWREHGGFMKQRQRNSWLWKSCSVHWRRIYFRMQPIICFSIYVWAWSSIHWYLSEFYHKIFHNLKRLLRYM